MLGGEGGALVTNLDLEGSFMTTLDEPGPLPSSGEKSSPKQGQDSEHVQSGDSGFYPWHNKLVEEQKKS